MTKNPLSVIESKITAVGIKSYTVDWAQKDLIELNEAVEKTQDDCHFQPEFAVFYLWSVQYPRVTCYQAKRGAEFRLSAFSFSSKRGIQVKLLRSSYDAAVW